MTKKTENKPKVTSQPDNWEDLSEAEQDAWVKENASAPETREEKPLPAAIDDHAAALTRLLIVAKQRDELLAALRKADLIAADIDCLSGTTAEGRKAQGYGARLHALVTAAIARAEKGAGQTPSKVVIHVEGGLVQAVYSDLDALDVSVIDVDDLEEDFLRAERDNYLASKTLPLNEIDFAFNPDAPEVSQ